MIVGMLLVNALIGALIVLVFFICALIVKRFSVIACKISFKTFTFAFKISFNPKIFKTFKVNLIIFSSIFKVFMLNFVLMMRFLALTIVRIVRLAFKILRFMA